MKKDSYPVALTIAGSDPSGGAGIQADLKTFHQNDVYGMSVITLLTVQNTTSVREVIVMDEDIVRAQLRAVLEDMPCHAAKTGALGNEKVIRAIAAQAGDFKFPLVVDPVMISKHGTPLLTDPAVKVLKKKLLPLAALVTPNLHEAEVLTGMRVSNPAEMEAAAVKISETGAKAVLITGGHLQGEPVDVLYFEGKFERFSSHRVQTAHTHGIGCTFSAFITAELAKGKGLIQAIRKAKEFLNTALKSSPGLGRGCGPVNHRVHV